MSKMDNTLNGYIKLHRKFEKRYQDLTIKEI
mgnify:CR=1 FL=1|jgi:hypothetical protein